jgi:hypothetical protein
MAHPIQRIERQMWFGFLARAVCFADFWAVRACGVETIGMKRVPGPRRVVVSFQFGGAGVSIAALGVGIDVDVVVWFWGFICGLKILDSWKKRVRFEGVVVVVGDGDGGGGDGGAKNRSSVCQRGTSNSCVALLARIVSQ